MKLFALSALIMLSTSLVFSQTDSAALASPWKHGVVAGLNLTQVGYTDWVQGGDNALAYAITLDGKSTRDDAVTNWETVYKFAYGQTRLGAQGLRKTDDKIDIASTLTYKFGTYVNPYVGVTVKSQFAQGFTYDATGLETPMSKFWDPGYLTQSAGVGYQPIPELKTRLGLALREIFTSDFVGYADDPATIEVEKTKVDGGFEAVTEAAWKLDENLFFTSKIEVFSPMKKPAEASIRGDNTFTAKVTKYINVSLNIQFINEKRISPRTQLKEALAMGLSYALF